MSWFYVDDGLSDHPKLDLLPTAMRAPAMGLWVLAGAWSRKKLTGGEIPANRVSLLGCTRKHAEALVFCKMWERTETGYRFHDWHDWQWETPELIEQRRAQTRERVARFRAKRKADDAAAGNALQVTPVTRYGNACNARVLGEGEGDVEGGSKREGFGSGSDGSTPDVLEALAVQAEGCGQ